MNKEIKQYNEKQVESDKEICDLLVKIIDHELTDAESKLWHAHAVWFLNGNPLVGYSKEKKGIRLMFWSGLDFNEDKLNMKGGKFKMLPFFTMMRPTLSLKTSIAGSRSLEKYNGIIRI